MDLTHKHMLMIRAKLKKLKHELLGHTASLLSYEGICGTNVVTEGKLKLSTHPCSLGSPTAVVTPRWHHCKRAFNSLKVGSL